MNDFLLLKLNRAVWVSLLAQEKIIEAVSYYENYRNNLELFQNNKKLKEQVLEEIRFSQGLFISKITYLAEKFMGKNDYPNALLCYTSIFKYTQSNTNDLKNYITCLEKMEQFDLAAEVVDRYNLRLLP